MRIGFPLTCIVSCLLVSTVSPRASVVVDMRTKAYSAESNSVVSVFDSGLEATDAPMPRFNETLKLSGSRLDMPTVSWSDMRASRLAARSTAGGGKKRIATAVAASALLPGLGELYLYLDTRDRATLARVPLFFALEGYLWYSYADNHSKGKDFKRQYETYADAHWSLDRFLQTHPCCAYVGGCKSWQEYNENCQGELPFFIYTPREMDREEYYENIGKYNAFVFGWDDWDNQADYWTPHRHYYVSLRNESDDYLTKGDQRLMGLIVSRVVSMLDAGWIAYRTSRGQGGDGGWSIHRGGGGVAPSLVISRRF
jgi:hypothetical protein